MVQRALGCPPPRRPTRWPQKPTEALARATACVCAPATVELNLRRAIGRPWWLAMSTPPYCQRSPPRQYWLKPMLCQRSLPRQYVMKLLLWIRPPWWPRPTMQRAPRTARGPRAPRPGGPERALHLRRCPPSRHLWPSPALGRWRCPESGCALQTVFRFLLRPVPRPRTGRGWKLLSAMPRRRRRRRRRRQR